jgi:hypothetical protein
MPALRQVPVFVAKSRALALWTRGAPSRGGTDARSMPAALAPVALVTELLGLAARGASIRQSSGVLG